MNRKRLMSLTLLALCLPALAWTADDDAAKKEIDKMQGEWQLVKQTRNGEEVPEEMTKKISRTVKDSTFILTVPGEDGEVKMKAEFRLDPSKNPKEIDVNFKEGPAEGQSLKAIYEFDGDTFKTCYGAPGTDRPKKFDASEGSEHTISVWKRVKKDGKKDDK